VKISQEVLGGYFLTHTVYDRTVYHVTCVTAWLTAASLNTSRGRRLKLSLGLQHISLVKNYRPENFRRTNVRTFAIRWTFPQPQDIFILLAKD